MKHPSIHDVRVYSRLMAAAFLTGCGGGTGAELDRILAEDRARQAERDVAAKAASADRQRFEAACRETVAQHLGMGPDVADRWSVEITVGSRVAGLADPETRLCAVVLQRPEGLQVCSVGRPAEIPDANVLLTLGPSDETFGGFVEANEANRTMRLWAIESCGAPSSDSSDLSGP